MSEEKEGLENNPLLQKKMKRRGVVALLAGGLGALALQACSPRQPIALAPTATASGTAPPSSTAMPSSTVPPSATGVPTASGTAGATLTADATNGSQLHLPLVESGDATATATEVVPPTPTDTPTTVPTASTTPPPSATPLPPATPFPPGPATRLGLFLGYNHPTFWELLATGNVPLVKTLDYDPNFVEAIKRESPNTIVVARYTEINQINLATVDPIAEARRFVEALRPIATDPKRLANIDAWEAYNEPVPNNASEMQRLATFEAERTRLLAADGIRSCVGNFATGQPDLTLWPDFLPAVQAAKETNGYLGLHEYSAPTMWFGSGAYQLQAGQDEGDEGWLTLRYRKVYRQYLQPAGLDVPLLITETGIDGQVGNRPGPAGLGWQDFQDYWMAEGLARTSSAGFYMEQLAWYDAELQQDSYVKGAAIFALAAPPGWATFELIGAHSDLLRQYLAVHPRR